MIGDLIVREGDYVDHPADRGGPTRWGITQAKAREHGYRGRMQDLPQATAREIYWQQFVLAPGINRIAARSVAIAAEALDTGVNMGAPIGVMFLQTALNALNRQGRDWPDLAKVDGNFGPLSDAALATCIRVRAHDDWEAVLLAAMNGQQLARYLDIMDRRPNQEAFGWGWIRNRVALAA
ncbi:hypothetical protein GCM10011380_08960 [Sphingomonas metalli]|uniref:Secretion activator protein n=2 Tax=Sphingomonas metalli TaxID=1779358 RepID=A0A916WPA9_9SPHN|nr:hypothetical protein GCM10011380_08960 [Sphingomonas metalli]